MNGWRSLHIGWSRFATFFTAAMVLAHADEQPVSPGLKARTWDIATTIPTGAYRATTPVELKGNFEIKVEPGAHLDGIDFQSKEGAQHWEIDGSFLKEVHIGPPIGGRFVARNSIFEDCLFYKKASGFDAFWSTRWTFENCVITRDFMHAPVNMADYSIVARSCTFVGVEFVELGLKEQTDPASYLQSDDFVFEHCRFVRCKVPASVLAATRDCVFEQCSFPRMKGNWPAEMTEIHVDAYWDSVGTPSSPVVRKPLVVSFSKLPGDFDPVGSSIEFTQSGGVVQSTDFPKPDHFEQIATERGTSSDLSTQ